MGVLWRKDESRRFGQGYRCGESGGVKLEVGGEGRRGGAAVVGGRSERGEYEKKRQKCQECRKRREEEWTREKVGKMAGERLANNVEEIRRVRLGGLSKIGRVCGFRASRESDVDGNQESLSEGLVLPGGSGGL